MTDVLSKDNQGRVPPPAFGVSKRKKWVIFIGLMMGNIAPSYAAMSRSTILPAVLSEFNAMDIYALVLMSGSLAMTISLSVAGKLGDIVGRRKILITCIICYLCAIVIIASSLSAYMFMLGIFLAGVAYGFINPSVTAHYADICTPSELPKFQGYAYSCGGAATLLAPVLGGLFCDTIGWQWVYLVCIPFMLTSLFIVIKELREPPKQPDTSTPAFDAPGLAAIILTIGPFLYLLSTAGNQTPWFSATFFALLAVSAASFIILIFIENKAASPIIPVSLLKNGPLAKLFLVALCANITFTAQAYYAVYLQNVLGLSATISGSLQLPRGLLGILVSSLVGIMISRTGRYKAVLIAETLIMAASFLFFIFFGPSTGMVLFVAASIVNGLGQGGINACVISLAQSSVPRNSLGSATGLVLFAGSLGYSIGNASAGPIINGAWFGAASLIPESLKTTLSPENYGALLNQATLRLPAYIDSIRDTLPISLWEVFDDTVYALRTQLMMGVRWIHIMYIVFIVFAVLIAFTLKEDKGQV